MPAENSIGMPRLITESSDTNQMICVQVPVIRMIMPALYTSLHEPREALFPAG